MATTQILRWAFRSVLRHPAPWLLCALLVAAWPALATLTNLSLTTNRGSLPGMLQQLVSLGLLAGVLWGQALATRTDWLLARAVGLRRLWAEALLMATPALVFGLAPVASVIAAGGLPKYAVTELAATTFGSLLHLVALALVIGHGSAGSFTRSLRRSWWTLPVLVWVIPTWLSGTHEAGAHLAGWLDVRPSIAPFPLRPFGATEIAASLPTVAWALVAILLATAPFSHHALRRSR